MGIVVNIILFLHFFGFVLALGSSIAMYRSSPVTSAANAEQKPVAFGVMKALGSNVVWGLALLWITGPLLLVVKYQGLAGLSHWFWAKILFVLILSAAVGIGAKARRQAMSGDASKGPRARVAGIVGILSGLAAILFAILAFG